ncbi:MAG: DUF3127 domain-containing protein [Ignavibacteria bacterium]|nr:DUF3127 domain-containing protein [Ignavibacteria bacterium]
MNIKGRIHEISDTKQVTDKFKKRDFIVEYSDNPSFPQYIKFELHQDNTGLLDMYKVGDEVDITFDLRGKPWTNKEGVKTYFNSLVVWKLQMSEGSSETAKHAAGDDMSSDDEDLPF